jgi:hypothetical protein
VPFTVRVTLYAVQVTWPLPPFALDGSVKGSGFSGGVTVM